MNLPSSSKAKNSTIWLTDPDTVRTFLSNGKSLNENENIEVVDSNRNEQSILKNSTRMGNQLRNNKNLSVRNKIEKEAEGMEGTILKPSTSDVKKQTFYIKRPMNAFLIFCKKNRSLVQKEYPNLKSRKVTKILGGWWTLLEDYEKEPYTRLAEEYKNAVQLARCTLASNTWESANSNQKTITKNMESSRGYGKNNSPGTSSGKPIEKSVKDLLESQESIALAEKVAMHLKENWINRFKKYFPERKIESVGNFNKSSTNLKEEKKDKLVIEFKTSKNKKESTFQRNKKKLSIKSNIPDKKINSQSEMEKNKNDPLRQNNIRFGLKKEEEINFDLNYKIDNLPNLSYISFLGRKKANEKKNRRRIESKSQHKKVCRIQPLIGSQKRKNKHNIIHIIPKEEI